jgi:hypothetical protein
MAHEKSAIKLEGRGEGEGCEHHRGVLQYHTIQAYSCPYSGDLVSEFNIRITTGGDSFFAYHCDRNSRGVGKDELDIFEFPSSAPGLGK